ncbi:replication-relaxation family protein [Lysinibacillus endophyticus]|uniref:replication-relaxation family protein n=1 Tax=Ureibacillus endophyticus TaxID=1978490 RepID=UPI00209CBB8E|nr:replication-relaxation family protein [Lysinibacillus endophyticus]MCP1146792.1 replication-relaxation family protein [Lysinibacillus endophyticus]
MLFKDSEKQSELMLLLFKVRGANVEQLALGLYQKINKGNLTKTYDLLKKLERKGFVQYTKYKTLNRIKRMYYLSKNALQYLYDSTNIEEGYRGSGFEGDFGFFKHSVYKPPSKNIEHHLMTVDCMIDLYVLMKQEPNKKIDFVHNLYIAKNELKPDFSFKKGEDTYYVEIDRGNERGISLNQKFERYYRYFKQTNQLAKCIYFVVPSSEKNTKSKFDAHHQLRFEKVKEAYKQSMQHYVYEIDLCFVSIDEFLEVIRMDLKDEYIFSDDCKSIWHQYKLSSTTKIWGLQNYNIIGFVNEHNKVEVILAEINVRRTKIWNDIIKLQEHYTVKQKTNEMLSMTVNTFAPKIVIYTSKENLKIDIQNQELQHVNYSTFTQKQLLIVERGT